jgi:hypothetical protein
MLEENPNPLPIINAHWRLAFLAVASESMIGMAAAGAPGPDLAARIATAYHSLYGELPDEAPLQPVWRVHQRAPRLPWTPT